jgi:hypothetical protein
MHDWRERIALAAKRNNELIAEKFPQGVLGLLEAGIRNGTMTTTKPVGNNLSTRPITGEVEGYFPPFKLYIKETNNENPKRI